jgi:hypothetical protein
MTRVLGQHPSFLNRWGVAPATRRTAQPRSLLTTHAPTFEREQSFARDDSRAQKIFRRNSIFV